MPEVIILIDDQDFKSEPPPPPPVPNGTKTDANESTVGAK
jgi:hypothetical protein